MITHTDPRLAVPVQISVSCLLAARERMDDLEVPEDVALAILYAVVSKMVQMNEKREDVYRIAAKIGGI